MKNLDLRKRATQLYPNQVLATKWVRAVIYLRRRGLWVLDRGSKAPTWALRKPGPAVVPAAEPPSIPACLRSIAA